MIAYRTCSRSNVGMCHETSSHGTCDSIVTQIPGIPRSLVKEYKFEKAG